MHQLLETLAEADRRDFIQHARRRRFGVGDKVFWQGDPGDSLHLVTKGSFAASVSTPLAQTVIVAIFRRDDVFGELALVGAEPVRTATIVALEPSETLSLTAAQFEEWRCRSDYIDRLIIRALALRLREMTIQMVESLFLPIETRVVRRILTLHAAIGAQSSDCWIRMRQEELAAYCGVTRPTVNRVLRQLAAQDLIELGRGRIRILSVLELERRAGT